MDLEQMIRRSTALDYNKLPLVELARELGVTPSGPWVGGGAVRRALIGDPCPPDYDFFFANKEQRDTFVLRLVSLGFSPVRETIHHVEFKRGDQVVQAINFQYYTNPEAVIASFDYTICQLVFDGKRLVVGEHTLWDLGRRRLAVNKVTYPVATLRRLIKYTSQGYHACGGCLATLVEQIRALQEPHLDIKYVD